RDFLRVATQRLTTAETLLRHKLTLDAQYLGGYVVECSLKALILHATPDADKPDKLKRITSGVKMHRPEVLLGELRVLGIALPLEIAKRMRRFDWTTDLAVRNRTTGHRGDRCLAEDGESDSPLGGGPIAMTPTAASRWEAKRTDETRRVEELLREAGFQAVDAYRYNSASIRVRVIDQRFAGLSPEQRDAMVEPHLHKLPERTQADIVSRFTFAPSELVDPGKTPREFLLNTEFEDPSPSML
ncbi:MAG: hypothetical protein NUV77_01400, partial [Thermoguttaceae bacterium]|nr:hypothetical protein [Thermoguttaceae bacterium]